MAKKPGSDTPTNNVVDFPAEVPAPEIPLNELERISVAGILAREREIQQRYLEPLKKDFESVMKAIADRIKMPVEKFASEYQLADDRFVRKAAPPTDAPA